MAIKPIDSQIAVQRTVEYAKESNTLQKRNELMHDLMHEKGQADDEMRAKTITKLERKNDAKINPDDRQGSGGRSDAHKKNPDKEDEELFESPNVSKIDVRV